LFVLFFVYGVRVERSALLLRPLIGLLYQPWMIDDGDDYRAISGTNERQGKPASVTICPPQIPYDLTRARARTAAVERRRLTAKGTARP
jgi:hypothetical protein